MRLLFRLNCGLSLYFVDALGAPGKVDLDGVDGAIPVIQRELSLVVENWEMVRVVGHTEWEKTVSRANSGADVGNLNSRLKL